MIDNINGYMIVRLPEYNYDEDISQLRQPPHINSIYYNGVYRLNWLEITEQYYTKKLPDNIAEKYRSVWEGQDRHSGLVISTNLDDTILMLNHSNMEKQKNEIITLNAKRLGENELIISHSYNTVLGYDYLYYRKWSILEAGLFSSPSLFQRWIPKLNKFGLFDSDEYLEDYHNDYIKANEAGFLEPFDEAKLDEPDYYACMVGRFDAIAYSKSAMT